MSANDTNTALCKMLGIDPNDVTEVVIRMEPYSLPTVKVTRLVRDLPGFGQATQYFELRSLGEPHP